MSGKLSPPEHTRIDAVIEGVKAGLSGPGGIVSALLKTPLEKRREEWMEEISKALLELDEKVDGFSIDKLVSNDLFISTCLSASQAAIRSHVIEKKVALRNAVLNTALAPSLDDTRAQVFINIVDTMTAWHIKILDLFENPDRWADRNGVEYPSNWYQGPRRQVLVFAFPELETQQELTNYIVKDLNSSGLLGVDSVSGMLTRTGMTQPITTNLGNEFLTFIRNPIPETTEKE